MDEMTMKKLPGISSLEKSIIQLFYDQGKDFWVGAAVQRSYDLAFNHP